jgi:hypothetical protein
MNVKIAAFTAAAVLILAVPCARAQQDPDSQSALANAPAAEQQRHQRVFGTTPDRICIDGACTAKPPSPPKAPPKTPASTPTTGAGAGQKSP